MKIRLLYDNSQPEGDWHKREMTETSGVFTHPDHSRWPSALTWKSHDFDEMKRAHQWNVEYSIVGAQIKETRMHWED